MEGLGLPFKELLPIKFLENLLGEFAGRYKDRIFSPLMTIWTLLVQVMDDDRSCRKAVSRVVVQYVANGCKPPSARTGAYCKARQRLPEEAVRNFFHWSGEQLEEKVKEGNLWCGRRVRIADGSSVSMPDTPANQSEYPQPRTQAPGCGFPIARILGLFSLGTGSILRIAIGALSVGENTLLHQIWDFLSPGDVFLADRLFCTYANIALLFQRGIDSVLRIHQSRKTDFRSGKRLRKGDHLVTWTRPRSRPPGLPKELFKLLPKSLTLREVRFSVSRPGFRTRKVILVTTLLDPGKYPVDALAELYRMRWECELDLRHVKTTMEMGILRGKSADIVRKEIWAHLAAYNLIRTIMWEAGIRYGVSPLRISLRGTMQHLANFSPLITHASKSCRLEIYQVMLRIIASEVLPYRPDRIEPRMRKRRPICGYPWLQKPRDKARAKIQIGELK